MSWTCIGWCASHVTEKKKQIPIPGGPCIIYSLPSTCLLMNTGGEIYNRYPCPLPPPLLTTCLLRNAGVRYIIVIHALPPPVFATSLLMNTGVSYKYIIHFVLCPYWKHYMYSGSKCIFHIKTNRYIKKTMIFAL